MANGGWYGTREEWERLEAPLLTIDGVLDQFARERGLSISKNHKDHPERSMRWGENPSCVIQIHLESESGPTWTLWLCCSEDRGGSRFWRRDAPIRDEPIDAFRDKLPALLQDSFARLERWKTEPDELEFATKLSPLP